MKILNYNISMVRGDQATLTIKNAKNPFQTGDTVQFTVMNKATNTTILNINQTTFTDGAAVFELNHSTTASLTCGRYTYAIRTIRDGEYHTLIRDKEFYLEQESNPELDDYGDE